MPPRHKSFKGFGLSNNHGLEALLGKRRPRHNGHGLAGSTDGHGASGLLVNLISWYELEESGTADRVDSHGSNDLTPSATTPNITGLVGNCVDLQNSQELAKASPTTHGTGSFTVAGWYFHDNVLSDTNGALLARFLSTGNQRGFIMFTQGNGVVLEQRQRPRFGVSSDGADDFSISAESAAAQSNSTWYFVLGEFDAAGGVVAIEVNDSTRDTVSGPSSVHNSTADLTMGEFNGGGHFFDGKLDSWGYWGRLLSAAEKSYLYNGGSGRAYADL